MLKYEYCGSEALNIFVSQQPFIILPLLTVLSCREKQQLTEHLGGLEDESAAVKVSLIRLLQEKSATNKTLALENWRLTQRMRGLSVRKASKGSGGGSQTTPTATSPTPVTEGDNVSLVSGFSTFDEGLQEAYIGFVSVSVLKFD